MPILRRRTLLTLPILTAAGIPALAACSGKDPSDNGEGGTASAPATAPTGWQSLTGSIMGHSVTVEVAPLVRMDESTTMLPLRITRAADDANTGELDLDERWRKHGRTTSLSALHVIDVEGSRLWDALSGVDFDEKLAGIQPGQTIVRCATFGGVDVDHVTAWVPMLGYPVVKVMSRDEAASVLGSDVDLDAALEDASLDLYSSFHSRSLDDGRSPAGVEAFTRTLDDSTASRTTTASITTILASDVTFEFGKYDLTAQADTQLQTVAGQLASYPSGGELSIVGHTDDQADEAFNQTLSEQRAAAVRKRLGELTDLSAWSVTEQGKGEKEPAVQGTDDAARATNRRVVITLTPTGGTTTTSTSSASPSATASDDALPEAKGPVGSGAGSALTVPSDDGSVSPSITVESITRRDGLLLGRLTITGNTENTVARAWFEDNSDIGGIFANSRGEDGDSFPFAGLDGVTLLAGGLRYMPCDYIIGGRGYHRPLADTQLHWGITGGTSMAFVIWPDVGQDTLIVDHQEGARSGAEQPWRITDVSVTAS